MKTSGSYASLLRGVSQQAPEVRQPGQHAEQINLLSDPVRGLTRRRGTVKQATSLLPTATGDLATFMASAQGYRVHEHVTEGVEYVIMMREALGDPTYVTGSAAHSPAVVCFNRTTGEFVPLADGSEDIAVDTEIGRKGISALTSIGRILTFAVSGVAAAVDTSPVWGVGGSNRLVAWIRGGAYDRTYAVRLASGTVVSYTTPAAGGTGAAAAISPQNIAASLAAAVPAGLSATVVGSHILFSGALEGDATFTDGGDGSLIRGVYNVLDSVDKLPLLTASGHIVKIQTGPESSFYVRATTKGGTLSEARWLEVAGTVQGANVNNFFVGAVDPLGKLNLASKPGLLGWYNPEFIESGAGDADSNPAPAFLRGVPITHMAVFQDRLVVVAGAAVAVSAAGDYFRFFRSTVTTVPLNDPFEMIAQGGEDDTIRHSVNYSRNLVLFGDRRQYVVSGQQSLTPTSANMAIMTTYAEAAQVSPIAAGGQIYYARNREGNVGIHQIQPGAFVDSAESFPASAQISTYIPAPVNQIEVVPGAPSQLLVRSRSAINEVFVFSYLDQPDGRKQDAWSRWVFDPLLGSLMGMFNTPDGVLLFWLRHNAALGVTAIVCDLLPMSADEGTLPYLDSNRPWAEVVAGGEGVSVDDEVWAGAFKRPSDRYLIGGTFDEVPDLLTQYPTEVAHMWAGVPFTSSVSPTNPYLRDGQGLAILSGRTVISKLTLNMRDSSGMRAVLTASGREDVFSFNARVLGSLTNLIGIVPITSGTHTVAIGREVREYSLRLESLKWYPFTLVGIEWTGQAFNRTPRA